MEEVSSIKTSKLNFYDAYFAHIMNLTFIVIVVGIPCWGLLSGMNAFKINLSEPMDIKS